MTGESDPPAVPQIPDEVHGQQAEDTPTPRRAEETPPRDPAGDVVGATELSNALMRVADAIDRRRSSPDRPPRGGLWQRIRSVGGRSWVVAAVFLFGGATVVADATDDSWKLAPISAPESLAGDGYSTAVVTAQLLDHIRSVRDTSLQQGPGQLRLASGPTPEIILPHTGLSLGTITAYAGRFFGAENRAIRGEIVQSGDALLLVVRVGANQALRYRGPRARLDSLLHAAAVGITRHAEPEILVGYHATRGDWTSAIEASLYVRRLRSEVDAVWFADLGWMLAMTGRYEEAIAKLDSAIAMDSGLMKPVMLKGMVRWRMGRTADVVPLFEDAERLARSDEERGLVANLWGWYLSEQGDTAAARLRFEEAVHENPDDPLAWANLAIVVRSTEPWLAVDLFREALAAEPRSPRRYLDLAVAHHELGRSRIADHYVGLAGSLEPDAPEVFAMRGFLAEERGDVDAARRSYERALALDSENPSTRWDLVRLHGEAGHVELAIAHLDTLARSLGERRDALDVEGKGKLIENPITLAMVHEEWGSLLYREGDHDRAREHAALALEHDPDEPSPHQLLGFISEARRDYAAAERHYRAAIAADSTIAVLHIDLGDALRGQGRLDEAVTSYRHALRLDSASARAHDRLAVALLGLGDFREARRNSRAALRLAPEDAGNRYNLAVAEANLGSLGAALAQLDTVEATTADRELIDATLELRADILQRRAGIAMESADTSSFMRHVAAVLRADPSRARVRLDLARMLLLTGDVESALPHVRRLLSDGDPNVLAILARTASGLLLAGDARAVSLLRALTVVDPDGENGAWAAEVLERLESTS